MSAQELPDAGTLIAAAKDAMAKVRARPGDDEDQARERRRQAASKALDQWAPAIDQLTDLEGAVVFLGLKGIHSVRALMWRKRADGTPAWPVPDQVFGGGYGHGARDVKTWKYRTIVIHRAASPGRGHPGAALGRTNAHKPWEASAEARSAGKA